MSGEGQTIVVESKPQEPAAPVVAEVQAAQAQASAVTAQEAAASAVVLADAAAAQVVHQASNEISAYQERLASCEQRTEQLQADLQAHRQTTETQMGEAMNLLSSIRSKLEQPPQNPTSPSEPTKSEEPKPQRRSVHRWI